jgi:tRNA pseudouridine13 synthase
VHPFFDLAYCLGGPVCRGELRQQLEDFRVIELLDLPLDGQGEHLWVRARKKGLTTPQLADELARWASVRPVSVGYSGLKDKFAETEQWFSLSLPGREDPPAPAAADGKGWQILEQSRHGKKTAPRIACGQSIRNPGAKYRR